MVATYMYGRVIEYIFVHGFKHIQFGDSKRRDHCWSRLKAQSKRRGSRRAVVRDVNANEKRDAIFIRGRGAICMLLAAIASPVFCIAIDERIKKAAEFVRIKQLTSSSCSTLSAMSSRNTRA
jgi:hypothetical protein